MNTTRRMKAQRLRVSTLASKGIVITTTVHICEDDQRLTRIPAPKKSLSPRKFKPRHTNPKSSTSPISQNLGSDTSTSSAFRRSAHYSALPRGYLSGSSSEATSPSTEPFDACNENLNTIGRLSEQVPELKSNEMMNGFTSFKLPMDMFRIIDRNGQWEISFNPEHRVKELNKRLVEESEKRNEVEEQLQQLNENFDLELGKKLQVESEEKRKVVRQLEELEGKFETELSKRLEEELKLKVEELEKELEVEQRKNERMEMELKRLETERQTVQSDWEREIDLNTSFDRQLGNSSKTIRGLKERIRQLEESVHHHRDQAKARETKPQQSTETKTEDMSRFVEMKTGLQLLETPSNQLDLLVLRVQPETGFEYQDGIMNDEVAMLQETTTRLQEEKRALTTDLEKTEATLRDVLQILEGEVTELQEELMVASHQVTAAESDAASARELAGALQEGLSLGQRRILERDIAIAMLTMQLRTATTRLSSELDLRPGLQGLLNGAERDRDHARAALAAATKSIRNLEDEKRHLERRRRRRRHRRHGTSHQPKPESSKPKKLEWMRLSKGSSTYIREHGGKPREVSWRENRKPRHSHRDIR
ncbi:hypothetical protein EDB81DRAFT_243127 [Dactylonectria macrodidyma]|uniref:Uncharacterized protein n=1 Tax=Dactylonectria macrodidyma TaxID=307937 RepID=A0A9P9IEZ3_9HYPO|nr:hypothetical protein EDB81DRAFT_243127 [Dactylonectria macrodidyma]